LTYFYFYGILLFKGGDMETTIVTTKGQIVIPSKIRSRHKIRKGTKLCIMENGDKIILQPLTEEYFEKMAGILNTKGRLSKALLEERKKEKELEEKKWQKS
jgi:AbrB family looped-hinge helix DNA binding protein